MKTSYRAKKTKNQTILHVNGQILEHKIMKLGDDYRFSFLVLDIDTRKHLRLSTYVSAKYRETIEFYKDIEEAELIQCDYVQNEYYGRLYNNIKKLKRDTLCTKDNSETKQDHPELSLSEKIDQGLKELDMLMADETISC